MNKLFVMTSIIIYMLVLGTSQSAHAMCSATPCQLVTFEIVQCEFKEFPNDPKAEESYRNNGRSNQIKTATGLVFTVKNKNVQDVPCFEGEKVERWSNQQMRDWANSSSQYFYSTNDKNACSKFIKGKQTFHREWECCDTLPRIGICNVRLQLLGDVPAFLKDVSSRREPAPPGSPRVK